MVQSLMQIVSENSSIISLVLILIVIIIFIYIIGLNIRLNKIQNRLLTFTKDANINDLEQVIEEYSDEMNAIKKNISSNKEDIEVALKKLETFKGKVSVVRYNAFGEEGNDLSFSIAILDESKNGLVISSIYNRGESNTYAKPIENGESTYKLSVEEFQAIEKALKK